MSTMSNTPTSASSNATSANAPANVSPFDGLRQRLVAYARPGIAALLRMTLTSMDEVSKLATDQQELILSTGKPIDTKPGELWLRVGDIAHGAAYQTKGGGHRIVLARMSQYDAKQHDVTAAARELGIYMPKINGVPTLAISVGGLFVSTIPAVTEESVACKAAPVPGQKSVGKGAVELG